MVNRRERARATTVQEIKDVARRQLATEGPAAVSLRAIAREMGLTAPALYRYFPSFDQLVRSLADDLFGDVCDALEDARDLLPGADPGGRLIAVCRAFRAWSVGHPAEFGLLFGTPIPGSCGDLLSAGEARLDCALRGHNQTATGRDGGARFGGIFFDLFAAVWRQHGFAAPDQDGLDPDLVRQLSAYRRVFAPELPIGVTYVILNCWMRLYGLVSLEVFNHLRFALDDAEPFFEEQLRELAARLGIEQVSISERLYPVS